jgi:hypothetical protein
MPYVRFSNCQNEASPNDRAEQRAQAMTDKEQTPHTNDLGIAIRDGLDCLSGAVECFDWQSASCEHVGTASFGQDIDASDASNLIIYLGGAVFRVSITRIG